MKCAHCGRTCVPVVELCGLENISKLANGSFQRCHWHAVRDTYMSMWYDGGRIKDIRPVQNRLREILAIAAESSSG